MRSSTVTSTTHMSPVAARSLETDKLLHKPNPHTVCSSLQLAGAVAMEGRLVVPEGVLNALLWFLTLRGAARVLRCRATCSEDAGPWHSAVGRKPLNEQTLQGMAFFQHGDCNDCRHFCATAGFGSAWRPDPCTRRFQAGGRLKGHEKSPRFSRDRQVGIRVQRHGARD